MSSPIATALLGATEVPASLRKKPRTIVNRAKDRPTQWLQIEGIFQSPTYWRFAAEIPLQAPEGRRRKLPTIFYVVMPALAAVWRSFDNTEVQLRDPETWERICRLACHYQAVHAPNQEPFDGQRLAATTPITAQNFRDARASWLAPHWGLLREIFQQAAAETATELGYCNEAGPGSINNLVRERMLVGDGKVTREYGAVYRPLTADERTKHSITREMSHVIDKRTGQIIPASILSGANIHKDGAGRITIGYKTVSVVVRDNIHSNSTVILDVAADLERNEAKTAVAMFIGAARRLPGALGVIYDTALRGTHIAQLAAHGLVTVAPVTAKSNAGKTLHSSKRIEKVAGLGSFSHETSHGACVHELAYRGGQVCEVVVDTAGKKDLVSLGDPHLEHRPGKKTDRIYARFTVACLRHEKISGTVYEFPVRWNIATTGNSDGLNIAENIRAIPPAGPAYTAAYGWRQTIENDNHQSDLRKFQARGRAKTVEHNLINQIAVAVVTNGIARHLADRRAPGRRTRSATRYRRLTRQLPHHQPNKNQMRRHRHGDRHLGASTTPRGSVINGAADAGRRDGSVR